MQGRRLSRRLKRSLVARCIRLAARCSMAAHDVPQLQLPTMNRQ
jgi:hypothetical protein